MCGIMTMVLASILPHIVICRLLKQFHLEISLCVQITCLILLKELENLVDYSKWKHFFFDGCIICARDQKEFAVNICTC